MLISILFCLIIQSVLAAEHKKNVYDFEYLKQVSQTNFGGKSSKGQDVGKNIDLDVNEHDEIYDDDLPKELRLRDTIRHINVQENNSQDGNNGRRLFGWLKGVSQETNETQATIPSNDSEIDKTHKISIDLKEGFYRIATALENINNNLLSFKNIGYFIIPAPFNDSLFFKSSKDHLGKRIKRNAISDKSTTKDLKETQEMHEANKNGSSMLNDTNSVRHNDAQDLKITRRNLNPLENENTYSVKSKLLVYINESLLDIKNKIDLFRNIQQVYSQNNAYKIGYLISNVDTLAMNIINVKNDIETNKNLWDDKTVLDIFDKLKVTSKVLSDLTDLIKKYIGQSTQYRIIYGNNT